MNGGTRLSVSRSLAALVVVALLLIGAGAAYLLMAAGGRGSDQVSDAPAAREPAAEAPGTEAAGTSAPRPDVIVPLTAEAVERAGIVAAPVSTGTTATAVRMPGTVEPNAYATVKVTPLVAGRVTRVSAELGDTVRRGQTLAQIYSPELAEAQTRYISLRATLGAHDRELERTKKLVEIGAASRQELERAHAEHAAQTAEVQSARSRLELLGVTASTLDNAAPGAAVNATTNVPAPIAGVVTERLANVGLNVDLTAPLFTVVDLSTVWVIADLYEKDFSRVRVGSQATVTTTAYPGRMLDGRIRYIDPQVSSETRTAKVRVEVPNPRHELRFGMFAELVVSGAQEDGVPMIPRSAVQNVGDRSVVYLQDAREPGRFTEREVRLGPASGDQVEVLSGVKPGDVVVTKGSFFVRAERERLGLRPAETSDGRGLPHDAARVIVGERGFEPAKVTVRAGAPARITFLRTTDKTCGTEVVFPSLNIKRALPLNEPVTVEFTPARAGEIAFACGMNMLKGTVVVSAPTAEPGR